MNQPVFHPLIPGKRIKGDWFKKIIPSNIVVGRRCLITSAHCFVNYYSQLPVGLKIGDNCSFYQTSFAVEEQGFLEIGENCHFSNASIVVSKQIKIGDNVFIAGGVTIVDSNFHPLNPDERIKDIKALSPSGDRSKRPKIQAKTVIIENDVWIGFNATVMSGVSLGKGAVVEPGSVVTRSVAAGKRVFGNPAKEAT